MSNKKSAEADKSAELQELERRVDAMMSTEQRDLQDNKAAAVTAAKTSELRIVSDYPGSPKTAPELSLKLLKSPKAAKPPKSKARPEPTIAELAAQADPVATEHAELPQEPEESRPASEPGPKPEPGPTPAGPPPSLLEDAETDKAVEDIVIHEGDTQLAVDDAIAKRKSAEADSSPGPGIVMRFFTNPWTWLFIIGTAAVAYAWFR